jgi:hypothetical protein
MEVERATSYYQRLQTIITRYWNEIWNSVGLDVLLFYEMRVYILSAAVVFKKSRFEQSYVDVIDMAIMLSD